MYLVTGGTGFIGNALIKQLVASIGCGNVIASVRKRGQCVFDGVVTENVGDISATTVWHPLLENVEIVVHCAANNGSLPNKKKSQESDCMSLNYEGTVRLAEQAAEAGVRRFVFLSSVKVNGEETDGKNKFMADDAAAPRDFYAQTKYLAEEKLLKISHETGLEVVILRPPVVYGDGVRGNFLTLIDWINRGLPLPLKSINNLRSFVALDNLIDCIILCSKHPDAAGERFLVSDDDDISTPRLVELIAESLGKSASMFSLPPSLLVCAARLIGKSYFATRLCGSLQVDIEKTCCCLGWQPRITAAEGVRIAVQGWRSNNLIA